MNRFWEYEMRGDIVKRRSLILPCIVFISIGLAGSTLAELEIAHAYMNERSLSVTGTMETACTGSYALTVSVTQSNFQLAAFVDVYDNKNTRISDAVAKNFVQLHYLTPTPKLRNVYRRMGASGPQYQLVEQFEPQQIEVSFNGSHGGEITRINSEIYIVIPDTHYFYTECRLDCSTEITKCSAEIYRISGHLPETIQSQLNQLTYE